MTARHLTCLKEHDHDRRLILRSPRDNYNTGRAWREFQNCMITLSFLIGYDEYISLLSIVFHASRKKYFMKESWQSLEALLNTFHGKRDVYGIFWVSGVVICLWLAVCR